MASPRKVSSLIFMLPLFLRTATVTKFGERIITPSITACPPTAKSILGMKDFIHIQDYGIFGIVMVVTVAIVALFFIVFP